MTAKVSDVSLMRKRSSRSNVMPQTIIVQEAGDRENIAAMTTMADSLSPLTTSMKLFGLYFKCGTDDSDMSEKQRRRWNVYMIHAGIVVVLMWLNVFRMFSVFKLLL